MLQDKVLLYSTTSEEETSAIALSFARRLKEGDIVCLEGNLGAGKTHFAKGIASYFDVDPQNVTSPTFTYMHLYEGRLPVVHFDLYRMKDEKAFLGQGFDEYLEPPFLALIEWPAIIRNYLSHYFEVKMMHTGEKMRSITIHLPNERICS